MVRPRHCRRIASLPRCGLFKPAGVPACTLEEVVLEVDELEALRLSDLEGLYQEDAAARMKVSRATFGRIVESARRKVADALVAGKALRIEGGAYEQAEMREFACDDCNHAWQEPFGAGRPGQCPSCSGRNFHRRGCERAPGGGCRRKTSGPQTPGEKSAVPPDKRSSK